MSNHVSPAQRLSSDSVRLVIQYLTKETRQSSGSVTCSMSLIQGLLSVSSTWRQATLEYMWRELRLVINKDKDVVYNGRPKWFDYDWVAQKIEHLVIELSINVPWAYLLNGTAYEQLSEYMKNMSTLSLVRKLRINISDQVGNPDYTVESSSNNAIEFAQLLRSLTPEVTSVEVKYEETTSRLLKFEEKALGEFLKSVYDNAQSTMLDTTEANFKQTHVMDCISQLSSLKLCCTDRLDIYMGLVRKCADTLIQLEIKTGYPKALFYDTDSNVVVYPNLIDLELCTHHPILPDYKVLIENIVPFPSLKKLVIPNGYPFSDDVLFRGNSDTLEQLLLTIMGDDLTMLNMYRVFGRKYKVLRMVSINETLPYRDFTRVPETETNKLFGDLLYTSRILSIGTEILAARLISAAQVGHGFKYIQKLDAPWVKLSLFNILSLVKALPSLLKLTCGINGLGSELDHISAEELPAHVSSTYVNLGKSLWSWYIPSYSIHRYREVIKCVLLLALTCPKLRRVTLKESDVSSFISGIAEVLESEPYSKSVPLLSHLLDGIYCL